MSEEVKREFIHGIHIPKEVDKDGKVMNRDAMVIKEKLHYPDGRIIPRLITIYDFKRSFYITKEVYRNHKQNKQWEYLDKLDKFTSTQSDLSKSILQKLGMNKFGKVPYRSAVKSPYVYGSDPSPLVLIKEEYFKRYGMRTPLDIAFWDIENDVDNDVISIISATRRVSKERIDVFAVINTTSYEAEIENIGSKVKKALMDNLPDNFPKGYRDALRIVIVEVSTEADLILKFWDKMHLWGPDILSSWGIHDITHSLKRMKALNLSPKDILSDPNLDFSLRRMNIKRDKEERVSQSGKVTKVDFEKQWHLYRSPAKFYLMDNMAAFFFNKRNEQEQAGGYSLENTLQTVLKFGKLKFTGLPQNLTKEEEHRFLLKNKTVEYFAYNLFDDISMLSLEEKTTDLSITLPALAERSLMDTYNYLSVMILDDFHFFALDNDKVLGSQVVGEAFDGSLGRDEWTITLHPWKRAPTDEKGRLFEEGILPNNIGFGTGDEDVVSAYPKATVLAGLSKMTTKREVISIDGLSTTDIKRFGPSLSTGSVSHIGFIIGAFKGPSFTDFRNMINKNKKDYTLPLAN